MHASSHLPSQLLDLNLDIPGPPYIDLRTVGSGEIEVNVHLKEARDTVTSYEVEWDSNTGVREVQEITTFVDLRPNEIQTITTTALLRPEVQVVISSSQHIAEVQRVLISSSSGTVSGQFYLSLDTTSLGGSLQYTGDISVDWPANGARSSVAEVISSLSNVDGNVNVKKNSIDKTTYEYLVTFPTSMGNVPSMVAHFDLLEPVGSSRVIVDTVEEGNELNGSFRLAYKNDFTSDIPYDATEEEVTAALIKLPSIGDVVVERSVVGNFERGYRWSVTFISPINAGDVSSMTCDYSKLLVSNPAAWPNVTIISYDGNQLGGTFALRFTNNGITGTTAPIPYNAEAFEMKAALEAISNSVIPSDSVAVTRSGPDLQFGYTWTVQFLDDKTHSFLGSLDYFVPNYGSLTGENAKVTITKLRPGSVREVQQITINTTQFNASTYMALKFGELETIGIQALPSSSAPYCVSSVTEVQTISSSTQMFGRPQEFGSWQVSHDTMFRVAYGDQMTDWITANPLSNPGDCSEAASSIQSGLEAFTEFHTVKVTHAAILDASQSCIWTVSFLSSRGELRQLKVQAKNTARDSSFGFVSVVGADSVTTAVVTHGKLDAIKAALELLPNVGSVTVSVMSSSSSACTWRITFDTKAGSMNTFPQLKVALYSQTVNSNRAALNYLTTSSLTVGATTTQAVITRPVVGTSSPLGGYFALIVDGESTRYLPYDASAHLMAQALMEIDLVGEVVVSRSEPDENEGFTWTVTFATQLEFVTELSFIGSDLTGTAAKGVISQTSKSVFPPFSSKNGYPTGSVTINNSEPFKYVISDLVDGVDYVVRASARNGLFKGPFGYARIPLIVSEHMRPSEPTNVSVSVSGGNSVEVQFSEPLLSGGVAVDTYKVQYGSASFQPEIQEIAVSCNTQPAIQIVSTNTSHVSPSVQLVHIHTSYTPGAPVVHDVQFVKCDASGGSFQLKFNGVSTPSIAYNAKSADIKNALVSLSAINDVDVTFTGGLQTACTEFYHSQKGFNVTFRSVSSKTGNLPVMIAVTNSLLGLRRVEITHYPGNAPISGSFKLSFRGSVTKSIPIDASFSDMKAYLEDLDSIPLGGVDVSMPVFTSMCKGCIQWRITFHPSLLGADTEVLEIVDFFNLVTGSNSLLSVFANGIETSTQRGGAAPSVTGNDISGHYTLSFRGLTTDLIEFNADASTVKTVLQKLPNIGEVDVIRSGPSVWQEYSWTITFQSMPDAFPKGTGIVDKLIPNYIGTLTGTDTVVLVTVKSQGVLPLSGSFAITFTDNNDVTKSTASIPVDASAGEVASTLNALNNIGIVSVTKSVSFGGLSWRVTFTGCKSVNDKDICNYGNVNNLVVDSSTTCPMAVSEVSLLMIVHLYITYLF